MRNGLYLFIFMFFAVIQLSAAPAMHTAAGIGAKRPLTAANTAQQYHAQKSLRQRVNNFIVRALAKVYGKKMFSKEDTQERIDKKALWAKWLGIGSVVGLFIPGINLLSLPAAVAAVILGSETRKKTTHPRYARLGIIFGCITAGLILVVGLIVALVTLIPVG
jgi:ABC-type dipeptide/oligopeptide/nickel transport system permease component